MMIVNSRSFGKMRIVNIYVMLHFCTRNYQYLTDNQALNLYRYKRLFNNKHFNSMCDIKCRYFAIIDAR